MPMRSQAQRRWMHATHPEMAERWEAHTPKGKKLPERVKKADWVHPAVEQQHADKHSADFDISPEDYKALAVALSKARNRFRVANTRVNPKGETTVARHVSAMLVTDPDGRVVSLYPIDPAKAAAKTASVATALAPVSSIVNTVQVADPEKSKQKHLPERLADILEAYDTKSQIEERRTKGTPWLRDIGIGSVGGALTMGSKALLAAGGNPVGAAGAIGLGALSGAGTSVVANAIEKATRQKRENKANQILGGAYNFDETLLKDPEITAAAEAYKNQRMAPAFGGEGGAIVGSILGSLGGIHLTSKQVGDKPATLPLLGTQLPFSQRQADNAMWGGLAGGVGGLGLGLLAGYLYKKMKRRDFVNKLRQRLKARTMKTAFDAAIQSAVKTAYVAVSTNAPKNGLQPGYGRPAASSNRHLMVNKPEKYSAGRHVEQPNDGSKYAEEKLIGGEGDSVDPKTLPAKEVLKGAVEETEHTTKPEVAVEIAKDHVVEDPEYYTKLQRKMAARALPLSMRPLRGMTPTGTKPGFTQVLNTSRARTELLPGPTARSQHLKAQEPAIARAETEAIPQPRANAPTAVGTDAMQVDLPPGAQSASQAVPNFGPRDVLETSLGLSQIRRNTDDIIRRAVDKVTTRGVRSLDPRRVTPNQRLGAPSRQNVMFDAAAMQRSLAQMHMAKLRAAEAARKQVARLRAAMAATGGTMTAGAGAASAIPMQEAQAPVDQQVWAGLGGAEQRKVAFVKVADCKVRERVEGIIHDGTGILGIKKDGYLLLPGGGLNEGEDQLGGLTREVIEEADTKIKDTALQDTVTVLYDGEGPSPGFDGERTHFYIAKSDGKLGGTHPDNEPFEIIPYKAAIEFLTQCIADPKQAWAVDNNIARIKAIKSLMPEHDVEVVRADTIEKTADVAVFKPRNEYVLFNKDGKLVVKRSQNRRFELPAEGTGRPAPYEAPVQFLPPGGAIEPGVHGYNIGLHVGDTDTVPEGYEAVDPQDALKDMYASMGMKANAPYTALDRARVRAILRALKKRTNVASPALPA